jgi:hypothetical protein
MTPEEIKAAIDAALSPVTEKIVSIEKRLSALEKAKAPAISAKEIAVIRENAESAAELAKFAQDEVRELSIRILGPGAVPSKGE